MGLTGRIGAIGMLEPSRRRLVLRRPGLDAVRLPTPGLGGSISGGRRSGLIHSATGTGKTLAAWLGPLAEALEPNRGRPSRASVMIAPPLRVLWITPLRALAADTTASLDRAAGGARGALERSSLRTGDTASSVRKKSVDCACRPPSSPLPRASASCSPQPDASRCGSPTFASWSCDEWHELMGTKRGRPDGACPRAAPGECVQRSEPGACRRRLGNLEEAKETLLAGRARGPSSTAFAGEPDRHRRPPPVHASIGSLGPVTSGRAWSGQVVGRH